MTIRDLKDIIRTFDDSFDDYKVVLWDYNHQRELNWGGLRALSNSDKSFSFSIDVPTEDGINIIERLKEFCKNQRENGVCKKDKR